MNENDQIADQIERCIENMFAYFRQVDSGATEYSIFYNPKASQTWFIAIFFKDKSQLKESIKNGICYNIYTYLTTQLNNFIQTSNISSCIYFESGLRPTNENDIEELFNIFLKRQTPTVKGNDNDANEICQICEHNFNDHQVLCNLENEGDTPKEGWIVCPDENCNCFQTWSSNYSADN